MLKNKTILFLGPADSPLLEWMKDNGEKIIQYSDKITADFIDKNNISFLISYGYNHVVKKEVLDKLPNKAINLHISYLPWNRGADPNFWSFVENTPKGVTTHYMDESVDTGDIIVQKKVIFDYASETLTTTYGKLHEEIQKLFKKYWHKIKIGDVYRKKQSGKSSYHKIGDMKHHEHLLTNGWDTPILNLITETR